MTYTKSVIASLLLAVSFAAAPAFVGCDKELGRSENTTSDSNGNRSTVEQTTVQHPDGSVTTEKQKTNTNVNPY
jgi:hypothetical protein